MALLVHVCALPAALALSVAVFCLTVWAACVRAVTLPPPDIQHAEDAMLRARVLHVQYERTSNTQVHGIRAWRRGERSGVRRDAPVLLVVHGTAGSSMSCVGALDELANMFDVHAIDLPGFGRTDAPSDLLSRSDAEILDFFVSVLRRYVAELGIGPVCVMGHSFGGHLAVHFAARHPELVSRLVLVAPAGVFPTLGAWGAYWALLFKLRLPQSLLRSLRRLGVVRALCMGQPAPCPWGKGENYWLQLLSSPTGVGDRVVSRLITTGFMGSRWSRPALHELLGLRVPVGLIYGERDTIMPPHQGYVLSRLGGLPLRVVAGAGHSVHDTHPEQFAKAFVDVHRDAMRPDASPELQRRVPIEVMRSYVTPYSIACADGVIQRMYLAMMSS